jgi:YegS/Rv2252/BmrU family lipid kinase
MRSLIIANPSAAAGKAGSLLGECERAVRGRYGECEVRTSPRAGGIAELVRSAADAGGCRLFLVGGDGTVNEAINGLADADGAGIRADAPPMTFIPAGTGGDFARTIGASGLAVGAVVEESTPRRIDVGLVRLIDQAGAAAGRFFLNIASFGVSAAIADRVNRGSKRVGGRLAFTAATLSALVGWRDLRVRLRVDDRVDRELAASAIVVANGRFFGGGMMVSPDAVVDDGLFDIVIMEGLGAFKFALNSRRVYRGEHLSVKGITVARGREVTVEPLDPDGAAVLIETDGEVPGRAPAVCTLLRSAVEVHAPWARSRALIDGRA